MECDVVKCEDCGVRSLWSMKLWSVVCGDCGDVGFIQIVEMLALWGLWGLRRIQSLWIQNIGNFWVIYIFSSNILKIFF